MLFASYGFLLFIGLLFIVYYSIPKKYQWQLLLGASYLFYYFSGAENLLYISLTTVSTYLAAVKISALDSFMLEYLDLHRGEMSREEKKAYRASVKSTKRKWLLACLVLNFGVLAVTKYSNFTIANINWMLETLGSGTRFSFWNLALPMGISFYTFKTMSYIIDVYRGRYPAEQNPFKLALFTSFFPQLVQGPISRFDNLSMTLYEQHPFDGKKVSRGLQRILWGFFKKVVLADRMLVAVNTIIRNPDTYQGVFVFMGMLFYAYQLYADFTGGIDITIGIAEVLGIKVEENFKRPYFSKSTAEYWRRWHITMGTWFKDYMFYPLSVSGPMMRFSKYSRQKLGDGLGKRIPVYLSTIIVWFTTGLWHGASWNFIVWGLLNGAVIIMSLECRPLYEWFHGRFNVKDTFWFRLFQVVRTVLLMSAIRMLDCYRDVALTFRMMGTMFTRFDIGALSSEVMLSLGLTMPDYAVLFAGLAILVTVSLLQRDGSVRDKLAKKPFVIRYAVYYVLVISIIVLGAYGIGYDASQFIYNQF